jgi:hypothetical protein
MPATAPAITMRAPLVIIRRTILPGAPAPAAAEPDRGCRRQIGSRVLKEFGFFSTLLEKEAQRAPKEGLIP